MRRIPIIFLAAALSGLATAPAGAGGGNQRLWCCPVGATVPLHMKMPEYTQGWLGAGVAWGASTQPAPDATIYGRDTDEDIRHVLLMRTPFGAKAYRTWKPAELAHSSRPWDQRVYQEKWPAVSDLSDYDGSTPSPPSPPNNPDYERFGQWVTWSE